MEWAKIKKARKTLSDNFHKRWVQIILLKTNAYVLFDRVYFLMMNLPNTIQSLLATLFISVVPILFIYILNFFLISNKPGKNLLFFYLLAFAIGGLLGDVFFHTLPHMNSQHDHGHAEEAHHDHDHDHVHA